MTKEEYLSIAERYYTEFESLNALPNLYDYEKGLESLMQQLSCQYVEEQLNECSVTDICLTRLD